MGSRIGDRGKISIVVVEPLEPMIDSAPPTPWYLLRRMDGGRSISSSRKTDMLGVVLGGGDEDDDGGNDRCNDRGNDRWERPERYGE